MRYLIVLLAVTSCATQKQVQAQQSNEAAYWERLRTRCMAYGFQSGTEGFKNCVMQLDLANKQNEANSRQILLQEEIRRTQGALPLCSSLPPGQSGHARASGNCR